MSNPENLHRNDLFDLAGRVALVTGASSGIGARYARVLAANGAKVVLAARRDALLHGLRDEIVAAGGEALAVSMDVTDEGSTAAAYDRAEEAFGTVGIIIANAGIAQTESTIKMPVDTFDGIFSVNVRGAFLTAREGMRRMRDSQIQREGRGRVVITSSITARVPEAGMAVYAASKAASVQLGRGLALEWATRGVNVNVLCPGYIHTELNDAMFTNEYGDRLVATWPRKRTMDISSLDGALLLLASDAGQFINGTVIEVDDSQSL